MLRPGVAPLVLVALLPLAGCFGPAPDEVISAAPWPTVPDLGMGTVHYDWEDRSSEGTNLQDQPGSKGSFDLSLADDAVHPLLDATVRQGTMVLTGSGVPEEDGDHAVSTHWAGGIPIAEGGEESLNGEEIGVRLYNAESGVKLVQLLYLPVIVLASRGADTLPFGWPVEALRDAVLAHGVNETLDLQTPEGLVRYTFDGSPWPSVVEFIGPIVWMTCCDPTGAWIRTVDTFQPTEDEPVPAWPSQWFEPAGELQPVRRVPALDMGAQTWGLPEAMEVAQQDAAVIAFQTANPDWFVDYAQTQRAEMGVGSWIINLADGRGETALKFYVRQTLFPQGPALPEMPGVTVVGAFESEPPQPEDHLLVLPRWDQLRLTFVNCPALSERPPPTPAAALHLYFASGSRTNATTGASGLSTLTQYAPSPDCSGVGYYRVQFGQLAGLIWYIAYTPAAS